jgi:hypothetical protein
VRVPQQAFFSETAAPDVVVFLRAVGVRGTVGVEARDLGRVVGEAADVGAVLDRAGSFTRAGRSAAGMLVEMVFFAASASFWGKTLDSVSRSTYVAFAAYTSGVQTTCAMITTRSAPEHATVRRPGSADAESPSGFRGDAVP